MKIHVDEKNIVTVNGREKRGLLRWFVLFGAYLMAVIIFILACLFIVMTVLGLAASIVVMAVIVFILAGVYGMGCFFGKLLKR